MTILKEMRKVTLSVHDMGLTKVFERMSVASGVPRLLVGSFFMEKNMGLFSRFMGKADKGGNAAASASFEILSPVLGTLVALEDTTDAAFSSRSMGDGVAVVPADGHIKAPVTGTVVALFPTAHALAICADANEAQVIVHIGIDTVSLKGEGFTALVAQGDHVEAGQPVVDVDLLAVKKAGLDPTTFCVVCERPAATSVRERAAGPVLAGEPVIWLSK